ncbi:uncharacterized protein C7orf77 homolog isoform X1 [Sapajus apella]|uniref:Uncharacterized protein C7orf77 homolog isoform X1 n=1 Tax=Sapajus apella TaxID=9515 RepID=A0A6J3HPF7_SAPAP|nr:uncharacterized protein C7orf77 homolog isoform X1 [Sapajus apella]
MILRVGNLKAGCESKERKRTIKAKPKTKEKATVESTYNGRAALESKDVSPSLGSSNSIRKQNACLTHPDRSAMAGLLL